MSVRSGDGSQRCPMAIVVDAAPVADAADPAAADTAVGCRYVRPAKPEEELRVKQLKTFCGMLLESKEEEVVEALMTDQFAAGVAPVLCQQITSRCQGKVYSAISSEDEDTQSEAAAREL